MEGLVGVMTTMEAILMRIVSDSFHFRQLVMGILEWSGVEWMALRVEG